MMNRLEYIRNLGNQLDGLLFLRGEQASLYYAFISCLSPEKAYAALDLQFEQWMNERRPILKKICLDIQDQVQKCHEELIDSLMAAYETLPTNKKLSCAYCLSRLCDNIPESLRNNIIRFLLDSKYISIRRMGYKKLRAWLRSFNELIAEDIICNLRDRECAQLIVEFWPTEYLEQHFPTLEEKVMGTRYLPKLYLRVGTGELSRLEELAPIDEITYVYIRTKLGKHIDENRALEIFERNKYSDRLGLLIWCCGQMQLWTVLERISSDLEAIDKERRRRLRTNPRQVLENSLSEPRFGVHRLSVPG
jgi:hypothetical protein